MGPVIVSRLVLILGLFHVFRKSDSSHSMLTERVATHDDLFPVEPGLVTDTQGTTFYACAMKCGQNVDCGGFVFVSTTSVCQLYQSTWSNTSAIATPSAKFYRVESESNHLIHTERGEVTCMAGWVEFHGSCYLFDVANISTFAEATNVCTSYGGHLAHVNTEQENEFLKDNCDSYRISDGDGGCWIGLTDSDVEGEWKWLDNGEAVGFTDWYSTQPNGGTFSNCLVLYNVVGYYNQWTDEPCGYNYMPICEIYMDG